MSMHGTYFFLASQSQSMWDYHRPSQSTTNNHLQLQKRRFYLTRVINIVSANSIFRHIDGQKHKFAWCLKPTTTTHWHWVTIMHRHAFTTTMCFLIFLHKRHISKNVHLFCPTWWILTYIAKIGRSFRVSPTNLQWTNGARNGFGTQSFVTQIAM